MPVKKKIHHKTFFDLWECEYCNKILAEYLNLTRQRLNIIDAEENNVGKYKDEIIKNLIVRGGFLYNSEINNKADIWINHFLNTKRVYPNFQPFELLAEGIGHSSLYEHLKELDRYGVLTRLRHGLYETGPNLGKQYFITWHHIQQLKQYRPDEIKWPDGGLNDIGLFGINHEKISENMLQKLRKSFKKELIKTFKNEENVPEIVVFYTGKNLNR